MMNLLKVKYHYKNNVHLQTQLPVASYKNLTYQKRPFKRCKIKIFRWWTPLESTKVSKFHIHGLLFSEDWCLKVQSSHCRIHRHEERIHVCNRSAEEKIICFYKASVFIYAAYKKWGYLVVNGGMKKRQNLKSRNLMLFLFYLFFYLSTFENLYLYFLLHYTGSRSILNRNLNSDPDLA